MSHALSPTASLTWMITVSALFTSPSSLAAQLPDDFEDSWRTVVEEQRGLLEARGVVGATLAFVHDGDIVAADHFGMEDIESGRRVDEHTIYHWASITKTFTAVGLMQLRDRGLVALDDPIVGYVPELRGVHNPFGSMDDITLRHLLSHSSGFRDPTWPWAGGEPWQPHEPTEWFQLVSMVPYTEIHFEPGSRYSYSNPGIIFLGRTLEGVTGDVYEAYIEKNIFRPLGLRTSYFDVTPWHLLDNRSNNYDIVDGEPVANGLDFNTGITVSNGGLNATVADLARWIGFLTRAPESEDGVFEAVLDESSLEEMWQPVVTVEESSELGAVEMGLSFFLYEPDGHRIIGHTGSQKAFRTFIFFDPEADVGLIGAYNTVATDAAGPGGEERNHIDLARLRALDDLFPLFWGG